MDPLANQLAESDAGALAKQFVAAVLDRSAGNIETIERFRAVLLAATLRHAWRHSSYYHETLPSCVSDGAYPLERLAELPLLTKVGLAENVQRFRTSTEPGIIQSTTGTTGTPITVYRTYREVDFLKRFQAAVNAIFSASEPGPKALALEIATAYHGDVLNLPRREHVLRTGLFDSVLIAQAARWLAVEHAIPGVAPRISVISGIYHLVSWFTALLQERGFDFDCCTINRIYTGGGYLTSRWKSLLEDVWHAAVIPIYSMIEVFTHAALCTECSMYHFLPDVIPELVSPIDHGRVSGAVGELVLTGLFPFNQGQPVIRYITGDLFRREEAGCCHGESYRFLGRTSYSQVLRCPGKPPIVIGSAEVLDLFDQIPEMARTPFFHDVPGIDGGLEVGRPSCGMEVEADTENRWRIRFIAELLYDPFLFPDAAKCCREEIETRIRRRFPELNQAVCDGSIELEVHTIGLRGRDRRPQFRRLEERAATTHTAP